MSRGVIIGSIVAFVVTVVAVVGVALVAIPALEGDAKPTGDPAVFVEQVVGYIVADDYTSAWGSLFPAHQRVARQTEYVDCEMQRPVSSTLGSIDVLRVSDRKLRIPGESGRADVKAVTLRIQPPERAGREGDLQAHVQRGGVRIGVDVDPDAEPLPALPRRLLRDGVATP